MPVYFLVQSVLPDIATGCGIPNWNVVVNKVKTSKHRFLVETQLDDWLGIKLIAAQLINHFIYCDASGNGDFLREVTYIGALGLF